MTTRRPAALCSVLILLSAPVAAQTAQSTTGSVTGYVWTANNTPIEDAVVQLRNVTTGTVKIFTRTTRTGEFLFAGVPPGHYVVECVAPKGSVVALGQPFTLTAGETVATFVRVANTLPIALPGRSPVSISAGLGWSHNLSYENEGMPGGLIEVTLPIGPGQWVVVEAALYHRVYRDPDDASASVYRGGISVAGRLGSTSHHGVFGQISGGVYGQSAETSGGGSGYRQRYRFGGLGFRLTPGLGLDVGLGGRLSWRTLAEIQVLLDHPRDRWLNPQIKTGLAVTLGPR